MRCIGFSGHLEPYFLHWFGRWGDFVARRPVVIIAVVVAILSAMTGGIWVMEREDRVNESLIARRGRIAREKNFYLDNFDDITPEGDSVVVTPKEGVNLLSSEALDELYAIQEHIRTFQMEYKGFNVSMEQMCFKAINADPKEPCWQSSLLESFREGAVFNVGGDLNSDYSLLFAAKPSYKTYDFSSFSRSFLAQTNLNPDILLLGGFEVDDTDMDTITHVNALLVAFGAKSPEVLVEDGLQYFTWYEKVQPAEGKGEFCPDETKCEACADALQLTQFLSAGCTVDEPSEQPESCCSLLTALRESPCVETVFERRPEAGPSVNALLADCGLPAVDLTKRCSNKGLFKVELEPDVCSCLAGQNDECTTAAEAFLSDNPEYAATFNEAANGSPEATAEMENILLNEVGCAESSSIEEPSADQSLTAPDLPAAADVRTVALSVQYDAEVKVVYDLTGTTGEARRLVHEWEIAWRDDMREFSKTLKYINVGWLTSSSFNDDGKEAANADFNLLMIGVGLVFVYVVGFCTFEWRIGSIRFTTYPPGPGIAILSFLVVLLSVAAAIGVAGYISIDSQIKVTFATLQQMPLLVIGLGVNDFFVLVGALKTVLSSSDCPKTVPEIMYRTMSAGGTSVTLSSTANAVAFALGSMSSVPVMYWYSVQMAVSTIVSYFVSITVMPCFLAIGMRSYDAGQQDFLLRLFGVTPPTQEAKEEARQRAAEEGLVAKLIRRFKWPIAGFILVVLGVWMGIGLNSMAHFNQGLKFSEAVEKGGHIYHYLKKFEDNFDTTQINIVFEDTVDYSNKTQFEEARESEYLYVVGVHRTEKQLMASSWMELYTQYVDTKFCSNEICMSDVEWYYDGFSSAEFAHPAKDKCAGVESKTECKKICKDHCPQGPLDSKYRCEYVEESNQCYCPYRPKLKREYFYENPDGFNSKIKSYWADFLGNTLMGHASRTFINLNQSSVTDKNPFGVPQASRSYVFARGLKAVSDQLQHIEDGRDILDAREIDVYPFDFGVYAVGEQFKNIQVRTVATVGITMGVAAVIMTPLLVNGFTAVIVIVLVAVCVLLTAGTTSMTKIPLDVTTYLAFVTAVGLSVEFCSHISRAFMFAEGDRLTRSLTALRQMGMAVLNGGFTTFLAILPAAFSSLQILQIRTFQQFAIIVASGFFVGLILLPTVLALVGPESYIKNETKGGENENVREDKREGA